MVYPCAGKFAIYSLLIECLMFNEKTWTFVVEHLDGQLTIKQKPGYENSRSSAPMHVLAICEEVLYML